MQAFIQTLNTRTLKSVANDSFSSGLNISPGAGLWNCHSTRHGWP